MMGEGTLTPISQLVRRLEILKTFKMPRNDAQCCDHRGHSTFDIFGFYFQRKKSYVKK